MSLKQTNAWRWWVLAVAVAGQFMFVVDAFIVNVAIPTIRNDLQRNRVRNRSRYRGLSNCLRLDGHNRRAAG